MRPIHVLICTLALFLGAAGTSTAQDAGKSSSDPTPSSAQEKGAITGTVSDQSAVGVAGATIKVSNGSGVNQSVTADDQGQYAVTDLPPGTYSVSVVARGAKIFEANVVLSPGQVLTLSVAGAPVSQPGTPGASPPSSETASPPTASPSQPPAATQPSPAHSVPIPSAQTPTTTAATGRGSIGGSVNDQTGAVVIGATVTVSNGAGVSQSKVTTEQGTYSFKDLPPGSYSLTVTAKGFKAFQADHISIAAEAEVPLDVALQLAGETTEVNVEGAKVANVETENAEVSGTITQKEVVNLELNGRNFTQLIALTPGVSNQTGQDEAKVGASGSVKYSVNGGRVEYNTFEVDGSDVLNAGLNGAESTLVVYPSLDAIQEIKVLTSNYGAQYGRTASGTVLVTTKGGGKAWHGNGYEFLRNEVLNARNYFDQTKEAPLYRRNDFGFTIGGPLSIPGFYNQKKDKTFVFWSEEFRYEKSPSDLQPNFNHAVPTLAERQGNFSDVCPNPNDPQDKSKMIGNLFPIASWPDCPRVPPGRIPGYGQIFTSTAPDGSTVYNSIVNPTSQFQAGLDPNALAILGQNLIPLPNAFGGCNSSLVGQFDHSTGLQIMPCYDAVISEPTYWREELFRIDHNFSPKLKASFRYIHDSWDTTTPIPEWGTVQNTFPTVQNRFVGPGVSMVARLTHTITPTLLNEAVFSYSDSRITLSNANGPGGANFQRPAGLGDPSLVGQCSSSGSGVQSCPMGYIFNNGFGNKAPGIVVGGNNQAYGGAGFTVDPSYMPWEHTNPIYSFRDDISKAVGKHTLQFGVQYVIAQKNETNGALGAATGDVQGLLSFSNINGGANSLGNAFANFLYNGGGTTITGGFNNIQSYTQDSTQLRYYNHYQIGEPYFQDAWRVNSRLTLNLGLRVSFFGTYHEKYLRAYNWTSSEYSPSLATKLRVDPGTGQLLNNPGKKPIPLDLSNLDPRITNGLVLCGVNGVPPGCMKDQLVNYAPRIGFAWDPKGDGKTSIRAGYGIFFEHGTGNEANTGSLEGSAPHVLSVTQPFPASYACIGNFASECVEGVATRPGAFPINVTAIPTKAVWPYSQQWSLSVQRELPRSFVATFAYVGSKGTHLTVERQLNQLQPISSELNPFAQHEPFLLNEPGATVAGGDCLFNTGPPASFTLQNGTTVTSQNEAFINLEAACQGQSATPVPVANTLRAHPGLGQIYSLENVANSAYNAFQTTLRRTQGPLTLGVSYSYSHSFDDASDRTDTTLVNSFDLRSNRASSNFDQRHLLTVSYVFLLPKLGSAFERWANGPGAGGSSQADKGTGTAESVSRIARVVADGWQFSGITSFQSGTPFSVINGGSVNGISVLDNAGVANGISGGSYPDVIHDPNAVILKSRNNFNSVGPLLLNPNTFVAPRGLTFGNAGRNFLNNPSRLNFDMALLKHFRATEATEVEFRLEAFNIFNHTQFRIYNPDRGNTGSNTISCYGGPDYSAGFAVPGGADCLTGSAFLHPVDAHRSRTLQLALKFSF